MGYRQAYPSLFTAGFVDISEETIENVFVSVTGLDTPRRQFLASMLRLFLAHLRSLGLESYEAWIGGSFVTKDPNPMDIDLVCFIHRQSIADLPDEQLQKLKYLGSHEGHPYVRQRWACDYYHCPFDSLEDRKSWRERFSVDRHGSQKGIARIIR